MYASIPGRYFLRVQFWKSDVAVRNALPRFVEIPEQIRYVVKSLLRQSLGKACSASMPLPA